MILIECVVFIHGIWMTGLEMALLRQRVKKAGYCVSSFRYPSVRKTPAENAALLNDHLTTLGENVAPDKVHFVAHSLGGIVLSHYFDQFTKRNLGRVVLLGSPLMGSDTARAYEKFFLTRPLLGKSIDEGLLGDSPDWPSEVETGMIAGTKGFGVGSVLLGSLSTPNDGTVAVEETRSPQLTEHVTTPHSHLSMLLANSVFEQVLSFLQSGKF